jgi:iron complex outermembrane receptor protein
MVLLAFGGLPAGSQSASRAAQKSVATDLTEKSLEDLMDIEVTSVSKKEQKSSQAAAAVFVISAEDIRRSGALNIPDLLRMVPGLDVGQISAGKWAISARGLNALYSDYLLVLVDGRTVYNAETAGVQWDSQNLPLESIERIEVVRGPGGAVWGSNAVNGVINIITKSAEETQGGAITTSGGNTGVGPDLIRYGGKTRGLGAYRVYAEGFHLNALSTSAGNNTQDDWRLVHGGYRADTALSSRDSLTSEGEVYQGNAGELLETIVSMQQAENGILALHDRHSGWHQLARWKRTISPHSETSLQVYFNRDKRGDTTYDISLNTFDIDFQHHLGWGERQDIVWGAGYRVNSDEMVPTLRVSLTPQSQRTDLFSAFAQDEIALRSDSLHLIVGARLEHNTFTGFHLQPTARLAWTLNNRNMLWSAVSGADRTPSRFDTALRDNYFVSPGNVSTGGLPALVSVFGNPKFKNERLTAFEAGYRNTWTNRFSVDMTAFYNRYRHLESVEPQAPVIETNPAPVHLLMPAMYGNGLYGETHGIEAFANLKVAEFWTLSPGYAFMTMHLHNYAYSGDTTTVPGYQGGYPDHQAQLRSAVSLPWKIKWNASAYFVNRLPAESISSYTRLDSGLTWSAREKLAISLVGQNLLRDRRMEFIDPVSSEQSGWIRRDAYAKITWSF